MTRNLERFKNLCIAYKKQYNEALRSEELPEINRLANLNHYQGGLDAIHEAAVFVLSRTELHDFDEVFYSVE